jgi:hypothetical protein
MSANDPMCHLETYYDGWAELVPFHRKQETVACNRLSIGWAPRVVSRDNVMSQLVEVEAMNKRPKTACIIQLYHVDQGSGEVSRTGAAPYMALKSSIYGTKFSIWH